MLSLNPYLTFDGDCEEAFLFYQSVFQSENIMWNRFSDMPPQDGIPPLSEANKKRIMHVSLPISKDFVLMGSDTMPGLHTLVKGNNFSLSLNTNSKEEADNYYQKLSVGGEITMPLQETFWGAYFGMWTDKFGIHWMVNYDDPALQQT